MADRPDISADADPYAWLEDVDGARALDWVKAHNRAALDQLTRDPRYQGNYQTALALADAPDRIAYGQLRGPKVYNFWQDGANPKGLWRRTSVAGYCRSAPEWEVLLDVDALAKDEGENWVFKGAHCSPSARRALIRLSRGGGDAVVTREFDLEARAFLSDGFALGEAKSESVWWGEDRVLFVTAADAATTSGYGRVVRLWRRGTPLSAAPVLYEGAESDVLAAPAVFRARGCDVAVIERAVSFFAADHFIVEDNGRIWQLPLPRFVQLQGLLNGHLVFTLREAWAVPGGPQLSAGSLAALALKGTDGRKPGAVTLLYAPGPRASVESVGVGRDRLYVVITEDVIGKVRMFAPPALPGNGEWRHTDLALPDQGTVGIVSVNEDGPEALLQFENVLTPPTVYLDDGQGAPKAIKSLPERFAAEGLTSAQFHATSADGTLIPYFVTRPKGLRGPAPTLLYGYGGFEVSLAPSYSGAIGKTWLERGGIYVVANIRGGGEFGPAWHQAAQGANRQRAFDDFAAVAADLVGRGLTVPEKLGIMGGSNGGLLVSAVMVQHPERVGAVVAQVPLIDMLAYTRIGAGASWVGEYGDPAEEKDRANLLRYSPYQNVQKGVRYPPVFFVTATSDDRVTPVHARKMAARMAEQGHAVLFYENTDGGHSAAADHKQYAQMFALSFTWLARMLGLP